MEPYTRIELTVVVMLIVCTARYCSAQCIPAPPSGLTVSPIITAASYADNFLPRVSGSGTNWWSVFSETQVRQFGLWCQVQSQDDMGMGDNVGDWYYPSGDSASDGLALLGSDPSNTIPYQSLKCTNQIGLVVDGDVTNNQGIVRCTTNITGLERQSNYFVIYSDSVYNNYSGPVMDTNMVFTLLSCRSAAEPIFFTLTFTVSYGPPSTVVCKYDNFRQIYFNTREDPLGLSREVIRSHYVNSSYPDMTRVTLTLTAPRVSRSYTCTVTVEGRVNIGSHNYDYFPMGSGTVTANITVAGTPTNVTANRIGYDSARVSWAAPSTGTPPAGYEVFYQLTGGADSSLSLGNTSSTELMLTELAVGSYSIFVLGFGAEGDPVLPSNHSETTTVTIDIPQMPPTLNLEPNSSSMMVSWSPTLFAPVIYRISYSCQLMCSSLVTQQTVMVDGTSTAHVLAVTPNSNCTVSVTAVFGAGSSSNTVTSSIMTSSAAPTGAPEGLTSTSVESMSLSVVWGTVPCPQQRGPIAGYRLRYGTSHTVVNATAGEGSRQHVLTGLTPYTSYSVQVAAVNDEGTGPYSTPLTVETLQDVPGPVSGLSADPGVVHIDLSWNPPLEPNGVIMNYEVGFSNGTGVLNYINTVDTRYTLSNVPPNTKVAFTVRAYTSIGPGNSLFYTVSTTDIPSISAVSLVHMNSTSVRVTWTPLDLPVVDHYTVHYSSTVNDGSGRQTDSGSVTFQASVSSGVVSGLLGGQQYQFSVSVTLSVGGHTYTGSPITTVTDLPVPTSCSMGPDVSSSTLVYTAGVGVVSALLLLSLMGNVVYTIVVCALTRKQKKHLFNLKQYQTQSDVAVCYTLPTQPAKEGNVEWKSNESYGAFSNPATMKDNDSIYEDTVSKPRDGNIDLKGNESYGTTNPQATEDTDSQHDEDASYI